MRHGLACELCMQTVTLCMQHSEVAQAVELEKKRFDLWPVKLARLDDAAGKAAEEHAQLERQYQDQVGFTFAMAVSISYDRWALL